MIFKTGELFCGAGGGALATCLSHFEANGEEWGFIHAWANDINQDALDTYRHNILHDPKQDTLYCQDVHDFPIDKDHLGDIDALLFGFPCNDFSVVGKHKGLTGDYGQLYTYGIKALKVFQPKVFIAENVSGLSSANEGQAFRKIMTAMENAGYTITPNLYKFEEYGVPQTRHRIIIVGIRDDQPVEFKVPKPLFSKGQYKSSYEALNVPQIPVNAFNNELTRHNKRTVEMLSYISEGGNAWSPEIPERLRLNVKGAKLSNIYKRLDRHKPAYTVTGSGGGGTLMYHYEKNRALTNRERARLQTFPDSFEFLGGKESVRKQIGMAIPPLGLQQILTAILKTFASVPYDWVEASKF